MENKIRNWTALGIAVAFIWMATGVISPGRLKAGTPSHALKQSIEEPPDEWPPDIHGKWRLFMKEAGEIRAKPKLLISLSGEKLNGVTKVIDDPRNTYWSWWWGATGKYEISASQIKLNIYDGGEESFDLNGTIMSGDSIAGSYSYWVSDPPYIDSKGTWTAIRIE
jgi:hypothetical protein